MKAMARGLQPSVEFDTFRPWWTWPLVGKGQLKAVLTQPHSALSSLDLLPHALGWICHSALCCRWGLLPVPTTAFVICPRLDQGYKEPCDQFYPRAWRKVYTPVINHLRTSYHMRWGTVHRSLTLQHAYLKNVVPWADRHVTSFHTLGRHARSRGRIKILVCE